MKPEWILRLVGIVVLEAIDRWRNKATDRAEARRLRALRRGAAQPVDAGFRRKGEP